MALGYSNLPAFGIIKIALTRVVRTPDRANHNFPLSLKGHVMADANSNGFRVVLYLRRSTDRQETSIEDQRAELLKHAEKCGYAIVREYKDEGISGDATEKRLDFLRMRDDCASGEFDLVLAWDQDRFSRNDPLELGYWLKPFRDAGVQLETISQGRINWDDFAGRISYLVQQEGKHAFLRDLSRNTTRGLLNRAREGRAGTGGPNPYGYKSKDGEVWIVPEEAKVVRLIFKEYLKPNGSIRNIAAELNRRKIKSPRSRRGWQMSGVRAVLVRRKYTGTFVYGARNGGKYHSFRNGEIIPRRKTDKTVAAEPITIPDRFEAIIDQDTFDRAQAKIEARKGKTRPRQARQYLLSGLIKCGDCGGAMAGLARTSGSVYRCSLYHQTGRSHCYCNTIRERPLVSVIVREIHERYTSDTALDRFRQTLKERQEQRRPRPRDLARLRSEIETLNRKIDNAEDATLEAPSNLRPGLYRKLEESFSSRDRLQAELASLSRQEKRSGRRGDAEIEHVIERLRSFGDTLRQASPEMTHEVLSAMIARVDLHFDHKLSETGRTMCTFTYGDMLIRNDFGAEEWSAPKSTDLITKGPYLEWPRALSVRVGCLIWTARSRASRNTLPDASPIASNARP